MSWVLTINGEEHRANLVNGKVEYDPPLDAAAISQGRKRMRDVLASRQFPGVSTDTTFFSGVGTLEDQFKDDPDGLREVVAGARSRGYNPSPFDWYNAGIADDVGDPAAFLKTGEGKGQIRKVCEERGMSCRGAVNVQGRPADRDHIKDPVKPLADDIVNEEITRRVASDPSLKKKSKQELRESVIQDHAPKID